LIYIIAVVFFRCFLSGRGAVATAALRRKKMHEGDLDKLSGVRLQLEVQINTLESANINANTLDVMHRGAKALKNIHDELCVPSFPFLQTLVLTRLILNLPRPPRFAPLPLWFGVCIIRFSQSNIDKVEATMNSINEQREFANEVAEAISDTTNLGINIDEVRETPLPGVLVGRSSSNEWDSRMSSRQNLANSSRMTSTNDS
jgi:charged multivesicular body protein 4